ncbi:MAG: FAD binding domain-containing protein [bacterium]
MSSSPEVVSFSPQNLNELDELLGSVSEPITYVAGATDLMVNPIRWRTANSLVNLDSVQEMRRTLSFTSSGLLIGAAVPLCEIIQNPKTQSKFPILVAACRQIGSAQIQNRATLGGNIANASPAGDSLPVLSVLDAELWIGPRINGEFIKMKLDEVMLGPGQTSLTENRYIAYIYLPFIESKNPFWYFRKVGQRYALAISKVSLAVLGWKRGKRFREVRVCSGSVSPVIRRATRTEAMLKDAAISDHLMARARRQLEAEISPIADIRSSIEYRRSICGALLEEALHMHKSNPFY